MLLSHYMLELGVDDDKMWMALQTNPALAKSVRYNSCSLLSTVAAFLSLIACIAMCDLDHLTDVAAFCPLRLTSPHCLPGVSRACVSCCLFFGRRSLL